MKASHLRAPNTMAEAFGPHSSGFIHPPERPSRRRQLLRALILSIATVAVTMLAIWLLALGGVVR